MAVDLPSLYSEAWFQPRQSIRRVLCMGLTEKDRLLMLGIHFALTAISVTLMIHSLPDGPMAKALLIVPPIVRFAMFALATYLGYRLSSFLLKTIGGLFGGGATTEECRSVNAWWMLVTSFITLAESVLALVVPIAFLGIVNLAATIGSIIIFSAYAAEVHGFRSVPRVAGVSVAVLLGVVLMLNIVVLALVPQ